TGFIGIALQTFADLQTLLTRQALHVRRMLFAGQQALVDAAHLDAKTHTELRQDLAPTRRARGQYETAMLLQLTHLSLHDETGGLCTASDVLRQMSPEAARDAPEETAP